MMSHLQAWGMPAGVVAIASIATAWYNTVSKHVPEPYLDEFFHVPQAQRYCKDDFSWDPKITTPPGLYIVSLLLRFTSSCSTASLRALNGGAICLVCLLSYHILQRLHRVVKSQRNPRDQKRSNQFASESHLFASMDAHTALNISLFPPLFFFSALFYTDVMSTLAVLAYYYTFLHRNFDSPSLSSDLQLVVLGIVALFFRQTNIFWVAIFPAALSIVETSKSRRDPKVSSFQDALHSAWTQAEVVDVSIARSGPYEYLLFISTIALAVLRKPAQQLRALLPYIITLIMFAGFVVWNGGVVLGDKSAHVATIHLSQMLYFWPYMVFFSIPITISTLLSVIVPSLPVRIRSPCEIYLTGPCRLQRPSIIATLLFLIGGLVTVRYNTIVHPYTLADNRHYVFYTFRILRQHPSIKYLAVPVYGICAWLTILCLGLDSQSEAEVKRDLKTPHPPNDVATSQPCNASFVVIWIITTTLSVATAPLVEPRYFIVPWIMWRLHISYLPAASSRASAKQTTYDVRLAVETIWLVTINVIVGYNFLYRGFDWPSEPGKVQRFLW